MPRIFRSNAAIALFSSLFLAAACSGPVEETPPDAGAPVDAGVLETPDAGPRVDEPIGAACADDGECRSGHCNRQTAQGSCIDECVKNSDCPSGAACEIVGGKGYCVKLCTADSECAPGYHCPVIWNVCLPDPGCQTFTDCPDGRVCARNTGLCAGALGGRNVGGACRTVADCSQGNHPFCIGTDDGFPGGYCSGFCRSDDDCGDQNACISGLTGPGGFSLCLDGCAAASDCRDGYHCVPLHGRQVCLPPCRSDDDCDGSGTCDTETGICSGDDAPDAGTPEVDAGTEIDAGTDTPDAGTEEEPDAGTPYTGGFPAPHDRPPQVLYSGGPVLAAPRVIPIFFANDDAAQVAAIADFDAKVGASRWWHEVSEEYGVGTLTSAPPVHMAEIATGTIDDTDVQRWLKQKIKAGELPAPDENSLYVLHYPKSITVVLQGQRSCQAFGGYHSNSRNPDGKQVVYAVIPRCARFNAAGDEMSAETDTESHELVEAATDPQPFGRPAYQSVDDSHAYYPYVIGGGETGDMCAQDPASSHVFDDLPYTVQRSWSNAAAKAGHDPCVPAIPGEVYFAAMPAQADTIHFDVGGATVDSLGVKVPSGGSKTIDVALYSDGETGGPWDVAVYGGAGFGNSSYTYTLNRTKGRNGDVLRLTITGKPGTRSQDIFAVVSTLGTRSHTWLGLVGP